MSTPCLTVLTARGTARLLSDGGSQAWRLNPETAAKYDYCVCVQNRNNGPWGNADKEHHHAFMIGRIKAVIPSPETPDRYLVVFSEYAEINHPNAWPGLRNPVRYGTLEEFGITDPGALIWHPVPQGTAKQSMSQKVEDEDKNGFGPLTISEAKAGLALGLGVPETAIEIIVKF